MIIGARDGQRALETVITQQQEEEAPSILTTTEMEIVKAIAQIFRKLGINTAHEAVKYALRAGLIDPSEFYI